MEKIINIDGRDIRLKSNGALPLRYKMQFGKDAFQDILKITQVMDEEGNLGDITKLDLDVFYNFIWVLAKTAEPTLLPLMEWLETFENFPIVDIVPEVLDMIISNLQTTKKK